MPERRPRLLLAHRRPSRLTKLHSFALLQRPEPGTQLRCKLRSRGHQRIDAATAERIGLVEQVVPAGEALPAALAMAERAARQSPDSVVACKRLVQAARTVPPALNLPLERELFVGLFAGSNQQEGVGAFLQKRPPVWQVAGKEHA